MLIRKKSCILIGLLSMLLFSIFPVSADELLTEQDVVQAYFQKDDGERVMVENVDISSEEIVVPLGEMALFSANLPEYSREVELEVDDNILLGHQVESGTKQDSRQKYNGKVKLWVKLFYNQVGNNVLITRVQSNVRNDDKRKYKLINYFMAALCEQNNGNGKIKKWDNLPLQFVDRYTYFSDYVNTRLHGDFRVSARAHVYIKDSLTNSNLGELYVNLSPWGGVIDN